MPALSIRFTGLCAFRPVAVSGTETHYDVYLFADMGHQPRLMLPLKTPDQAAIDTDPTKTTWLPDELVHLQLTNAAGHAVWTQAGVWHLEGQDITLEGGTVSNVTWSDKGECIDLATFHAKATSKAPADLRLDKADAVWIAIKGGALDSSSATGDVGNYDVTKQDGTVVSSQYTRGVTWSGSVNKITSATKGSIVLARSIAAAITNEAVVPGSTGGTHFAHYYDALTLASGDKKIKIKNKDITVYDCVPPGSLPPG